MPDIPEIPETNATPAEELGFEVKPPEEFAGPFTTILLIGLGLFTLILALVCLVWGGNPGVWGVLVVAMGALGSGALLGFIYGSFGADETSRFGPVFTLFAGLLGGVTLADLSKDNGGLNRALLALGAACGLGDQAGGLVFFVIAAFFPFGFMLAYVHKALLLNLPIALMNQQLAALQARAAVRADNPLPRPDPTGGGVKSPDAAPRTTTAAQLIASRPGAGQVGSPEKLVEDAQAFSALGQLDRSEQALRKALSQRPEDWRIKYALARVLLQHSGKEREACDLLQDVIQNPEAPLSAWMLFGYAALWDDDKLLQAAEASKKFLAVAPDAPGPLLNLACAYAQLAGKAAPEERANYKAVALDTLQQLVSKHPEIVGQLRRLKNEDFSALKDDPTFRSLIGEEPGPTTPAAPNGNG